MLEPKRNSTLSKSTSKHQNNSFFTKKSSKTYYGGGIPRCVKITFNSRFNEGDEERLIFFQIIIRRVNEYAFYSAAVGEFSVFGANKRIRLPIRIVIVQTIRT